jgi:hypothetical protein
MIPVIYEINDGEATGWGYRFCSPSCVKTYIAQGVDLDEWEEGEEHGAAVDGEVCTGCGKPLPM